MNDSVKAGKTTAIVAYLTPLGGLIAIFMNLEPKNEFARFHIRQAFGIHLLFISFGILSSTYGSLYSASGLFLCYSVLWVFSFIGAVSEKKQLIPFLGNYFQKWFTFIQ